MSSGRAALVMVAVAGLVGFGSASTSAAREGARFLAAGGLVRDTVVRAAPRQGARRVRTLREFRKDFRPQIVLAVGRARAADGGRWVELSLPGRPNGGRGWVPEAAVALHPVLRRIVILRGARQLQVRRIADGTVLFRAPVAVGKPGTETPLGRNFYVQTGFVPRDPFYGSYALETSAYAPISDVPGAVGIHGTDEPQLIGLAVSHGCIRMFNRDILRVRALAPPGTPMDVLP